VDCGGLEVDMKKVRCAVERMQRERTEGRNVGREKQTGTRSAKLQRTRCILVRASARGDLERVVEVLRAVRAELFGGDQTALSVWLNQPTRWSEKGLTPLHAAAAHGHESCCVALMRYGARLEVRDMQGRTAFARACSKGHWEVASEMLESYDTGSAVGARGAQQLVNSKDLRGRTALLDAAESGRLTVFRALLQRGADVSVVARDGRNVLHHAVSAQEKATATMLTLLETLVCTEQELLGAKSANGETALQEAARCGNGVGVRTLLQWQSNACSDRDLLASSSEEWVALIVWCATWGWLDVLRIAALGDRCASCAGKDCGWCASLERRKRMILSWRGEQGATVLHLVGGVGNCAAVSVLLELGCDVTARDDFGKTPLDGLRAQQIDLEQLGERHEVRRTAALLHVAELGGMVSSIEDDDDNEGEEGTTHLKPSRSKGTLKFKGGKSRKDSTLWSSRIASAVSTNEKRGSQVFAKNDGTSADARWVEFEHSNSSSFSKKSSEIVRYITSLSSLSKLSSRASFKTSTG